MRFREKNFTESEVGKYEIDLEDKNLNPFPSLVKGMEVLHKLPGVYMCMYIYVLAYVCV